MLLIHRARCQLHHCSPRRMENALRVLTSTCLQARCCAPGRELEAAMRSSKPSDHVVCLRDLCAKGKNVYADDRFTMRTHSSLKLRCRGLKESFYIFNKSTDK